MAVKPSIGQFTRNKSKQGVASHTVSEISASISTISFFKFLNINFMGGWSSTMTCRCGLRLVDLVESGGKTKEEFRKITELRNFELN